VTHGALTPVDVVKTRIQLEPTKYNKGMVDGFRQVVRTEGAGALLTGFGPTFVGYFVQGGIKFGGYEYFKKTLTDMVGWDTAVRHRSSVYLGASAIAEFIADIALCPLEAVRIRLVSQPTFAKGLVGGFSRILREEGVSKGFYSGFVPIVLKQVPYTGMQFLAFERAAEAIYKSMGKSKTELSSTTNTGVSLLAGVIAGVAAAVVSQPADTLLSKVNKAAGLPGEGTTGKLLRLARETGPVGLFSGLGARCLMMGTLIALQFGAFQYINDALGTSPWKYELGLSSGSAHH